MTRGLLSSTILPATAESLAKARDFEKKYAWVQAAQVYEDTLAKLGSGNNSAKRVQVLELSAKARFRAAFQAGTRDEFKRRMKLARESFDQLQVLDEKAGIPGLSDRDKARSVFATFWIKDSLEERQSLSEEAISLAEKAAKAVSNSEDRRRFAEVQLEVLIYTLQATFFDGLEHVLQEHLEKGSRAADDCIREFQKLGDDQSLAETLSSTAILSSVAFDNQPPIGSEMKARFTDLSEKISKVSRKVGDAYSLCLTDRAIGTIAYMVEGDPPKAFSYFKSGSSRASDTGDSYLAGDLLTRAAEACFWAAGPRDEPDRMREILHEGMEIAPQAIKHLEVVGHDQMIDWAYSCWGECYFWIGVLIETDPDKKKEAFRKAIEVAGKGAQHASAYPESSHTLSKAIYFLATLETDPLKKMELLNQALPIREETVRQQKLRSSRSWNLGVMLNYQALTKAELSKIKEGQDRVELLQDAVQEMEQCIHLCKDHAASSVTLSRPLTIFEEWFGDILLDLYRLTRKIETAQKAISAYKESATTLASLGLTTRLPPLRWKTATVYDAVGNYKEASTTFRKAKDEYAYAAEKAPGLAPVFRELASYMEAWSLIEEARIHHNDDRFLDAAENYSKAAQLLGETRTWRYLSKHYSGCSFLEEAEASSRQERLEEAIESFSKAVKSFEEARNEIDRAGNQTSDPAEKDEAKKWLAITEGRERLSKARIELEEAKVLDKKGEEEASEAKYRSAAEIFTGLLEQSENDQSRRELETLKLFSTAWAKMKDAETKASPALYAEAAVVFTKIEGTAVKKRPRLSALADAAICRALEHGTEFRRTRNTQLYSDIKKELETATDYYQQAGLQNAADWAKGTGKLFDALVYMADAASEKE